MSRAHEQPPRPELTLADLDENPAAGLILQAQRPPVPGVAGGQPLTMYQHVAGCLAYAEAQPPRIAADIAQKHRHYDRWTEAIPVLRRILAMTPKD